MKKEILSIILIMLVIGGFAQKPKPKKAFRAWKNGELIEAKDIIDRAAVHEKYKDDGDTWYYRGLIYSTLDTTSNPQFKNLADNPLKTAVEAFDKADQMSDGKEYYIPGPNGLPVIKSQQINQLWAHYIEKGAGAYNEQDYETALKSFEKGMKVIPDDTTSYIYAGTVAQMDEKNDLALKYFYKAKELGIQDPSIYGSLLNLEMSHSKDTAAAMQVVQDAIEDLEDNDAFKKEEIRLLILTNKVEPAKEKIMSNLEEDPDNDRLWYSLGYLLDHTDEKEEAAEAYKKTLEVNPDHFEANYNLGVYHYNKGVAIRSELANLGMSEEDKKKEAELKPGIVKHFKEALPYFEKVHELQPEDKVVIETLGLLYNETGNKEKAGEMNQKLEALGGIEEDEME